MLGAFLVLAGCQSAAPRIDSAAAGGGGRETIPAEGPYDHAASGFVFPASIGDFARDEITKQDDGGISVGYKAPPVKGGPLAVALVYPAPWLARPQGTAQSCDTDFQATKESIVLTRRSAQLISERRAAFGPDAVGAMAEFGYSHMFDGEIRPLSSRAYLFCMADTGWVLKLRFSAPAGIDWERVLAPFERQLAGPWSAKRPVPLSLKALARPAS